VGRGGDCGEVWCSQYIVLRGIEKNYLPYPIACSEMRCCDEQLVRKEGEEGEESEPATDGSTKLTATLGKRRWDPVAASWRTIGHRGMFAEVTKWALSTWHLAPRALLVSEYSTHLFPADVFCRLPATACAPPDWLHKATSPIPPLRNIHLEPRTCVWT
jgi:hypothetical protein